MFKVLRRDFLAFLKFGSDDTVDNDVEVPILIMFTSTTEVHEQRQSAIQFPSTESHITYQRIHEGKRIWEL